MSVIIIKKADGETEPFDRNKLLNSLVRSGADDEIINKVIKSVESILVDGMTTEDIYKYAFDLLKDFEHKNPAVSARFSIKRAILDLGPSGFPFEQFVAAVMKANGAKNVKTDQAMQGLCVAHEVDVVGNIGDRTFGMEVKFHNSLGIKTDVKVALYVNSRFEDLNNSGVDHIDDGWLVTNTRFTRNVIRYAKCSRKIKLLGWDYPRGSGLEVLIDRAGLHPVTMLTTLTNKQKRLLLEKDVVLCRDIHSNRGLLLSIGVDKNNVDAVLRQVDALVNI